jgi:thymidylate kinase
MKLLIVEGTDRCGKDSLINEICNSYSNVVKRHWSFPLGNTNEEKTSYQKTSFLWEFNFFNEMRKVLQKDSIMVWNRAHIGEMVYGSIYRDSKPHEWVMQLEEQFEFDKDPDVYLVYLHADPEFVVKEDDGKSYSAKLEDKTREILTFNNAISLSKIPKVLNIKVNEGEDYISHESIVNSVKEFLNT